MKKRLAAFVLSLFSLWPAALPVSAQVSGETAPRAGVTINIYNRGEYISDDVDDSIDVNKESARRMGIQVNYTTFENNENPCTKLVSGGVNYDVIIPSDYMILKPIEENLVQKLNYQNIPNSKYIGQDSLGPAYDPTNEYSVPYTWGVVGIFYNEKCIKEAVDSWDILWDKKYAGKALMFDSPCDAFGIAQKRLDSSFNSTDPNEWEEAVMLLKKQKPLVQTYVMDQTFDKMASDEAQLAPYYAGNAAALVDPNPDIGFAVPTKQGTNFFVGAMCIPTSAQNKAAAEAYINFPCDPEIATANVDYIGCFTPENVVKALLPGEIQDNPIYCPPKEILEKAGAYVTLPDDTNLLLDTLWAEVKMGGPGQTTTLIAILAGFLLLHIVVVLYKRHKRRWDFK